MEVLKGKQGIVIIIKKTRKINSPGKNNASIMMQNNHYMKRWIAREPAIMEE